jgi:hypothetical protein
VSELFYAILLPRKLQEVGKCLYGEKALKFVPQLKKYYPEAENGHDWTFYNNGNTTSSG